MSDLIISSDHNSQQSICLKIMSVVLSCLCFDKSFLNNAESRAREIGEACAEGMNKYTLSVCICVFRLW